MLSRDEIAHYRAFGFIMLRQCLASDEFAELEAAYERLMQDAESYDYFGKAGTRTAMGAEEKDPVFAAFVVHPKIIQAMRDLWGAPGLYLGCDIWSNRDDTPWHTDGAPGRLRGTVKVTIYLDEMTAEQGSLNLIPGSHLPASSANLFTQFGYFDRRRPRLRLPPDAVPGAVSLHTNPGDVVVWNTRLWHSAFKRRDGRPRRALFFSYVPDPQGDLLDEQFARDVLDGHRSSEDGPLYGPHFVAHGDPHIEWMITRAEELGIENVRPQTT